MKTPSARGLRGAAPRRWVRSLGWGGTITWHARAAPPQARQSKSNTTRSRGGRSRDAVPSCPGNPTPAGLVSHYMGSVGSVKCGRIVGVSQNRGTTACSCPTKRPGPTKLGHTPDRRAAGRSFGRRSGRRGGTDARPGPSPLPVAQDQRQVEPVVQEQPHFPAVGPV
jgi:hypothetical protein